MTGIDSASKGSRVRKRPLTKRQIKLRQFVFGVLVERSLAYFGRENLQWSAPFPSGKFSTLTKCTFTSRPLILNAYSAPSLNRTYLQDNKT